MLELPNPKCLNLLGPVEIFKESLPVEGGFLLLPNDCLSYLFDTSYPFLTDITPLFITCHKLNTISDTCTNSILQKNYKLLIRNNYLKTPKQTYNSIYKIYGEKFVMCKTKLCDLAFQSVITNNIELLGLLHKNASKTMKSKRLHDGFISKCSRYKIIRDYKLFIGTTTNFRRTII